MSIIFIIVLSGMYLAIVNVIEKKKAAEMFWSYMDYAFQTKCHYFNQDINHL